MGLVVIETGKWSDQFVKGCREGFLKLKLEQQRYGDKRIGKKSEAVEKKRQELEAGEFEVRGWDAATLTLVEEQFRQLLSEEFKKPGRRKASVIKWPVRRQEQLFRDLCVKPLYAKLGVQVEPKPCRRKRTRFSICSK